MVERQVRAFVGSKCGVPSPVPDDDGEWNGYELGDEDDCVLCDDESCVARVIEWQSEGNAIASELALRLSLDVGACAALEAANTSGETLLEQRDEARGALMKLHSALYQDDNPRRHAIAEAGDLIARWLGGSDAPAAPSSGPTWHREYHSARRWTDRQIVGEPVPGTAEPATYAEQLAEDERAYDAFHAAARGARIANGDLHPTGRCSCAGEGRCEWCVSRAEADGDTTAWPALPQRGDPR